MEEGISLTLGLDQGSQQTHSDRRSRQPQSDQRSQQLQSDQGSPQPQSDQGSPQPQSDQGSQQPQSDQGSPQLQLDQGSPQPQSDQGSQQPQSDQGSRQLQSDQGSQQPQSVADQGPLSVMKSGLNMPIAIKRRGRPRGHCMTTIGLPCKRSKRSFKKDSPVAFSRLHVSDKKKVMLSWFVDKCVAESALHGKLIEENEVECRPEKVPNALLDKNVDINLIRLCFTDDAWMIVDSVLQQKVQRPNWLCHSCNHNLAKQPSIICDSCLQWNHLQCVGLSGQPKQKHWFCRSCHL